MSDQETPQPASEEGAQKPAQQSGERNSSGGRERNRGRRRQHAPSSGRQLEQSLNMDELRELVELINQYGFTDFELENKDVRVRLRRELAPQVNAQPQGFHQQPVMHAPPVASSVQSAPVATSAAVPQAATPAETQASADAAAEAEDEALIPIPSPIVGTFYRSPSPNAEPFVRIGSHVNPDTTVCIIEAMKLMNEIQAETTGVVAKIYVENGQPVEYGQPLFGLKK